VSVAAHFASCVTQFHGGPRHTLQQFAEIMAKALKKVYDRSYIVHVEQVNGQFQIVAQIQDDGLSKIMSVPAVAEYLECSRAEVRALNGARAQRCRHAEKCIGRCPLVLKFFKPGRYTKIRRTDLVAWCEAKANEEKGPGPTQGKKPKKK
jgi:hypothetical protein